MALGKESLKAVFILGIGVLSMSLLNPVLPAYLTGLGVPVEILGLMFAVAMAAMAVGEGYWGWVADRLGLRFPLLVGTVGCGLIILGFLPGRGIASLFALFFLWGLCRSAVFGPARGLIGASAPPNRKATSMAVVAAAIAASRSAGALPSGYLADRWGYAPVFLAAAGVAMAGGLVVMGFRQRRMLEPSSPASAPAAPPPGGDPGWSLTAPSFVIPCLVTVLYFVLMGTAMTYLPLLGTEVVGISLGQVGLLFTVQGLTAMVLSVPVGMLADRAGKRSLMLIGLAVSAAAMAGFALAVTYGALILWSVLSSLGLSLFSPAAMGLISNSAPREHQGTAMGFYGAIGENTGIILGSGLGGFVWASQGHQATFFLGALSACLGAVICALLVREETAGPPQRPGGVRRLPGLVDG